MRTYCFLLKMCKDQMEWEQLEKIILKTYLCWWRTLQHKVIVFEREGKQKRDGSSVPLSQSIRSQRIEALSQVNGWQRQKKSACMFEYVCTCTHVFTCTEKLKQVRPTPSLCWIGTVETMGWKERWKNSGVWKVEVIWPQRRCTWERGGAIMRWHTARGPHTCTNILWDSFLLCTCPEDRRLEAVPPEIYYNKRRIIWMAPFPHANKVCKYEQMAFDLLCAEMQQL